MVRVNCLGYFHILAVRVCAAVHGMIFRPFGQEQGSQIVEFNRFSLGQGIKILPNAGQEQGKGLDEPATHTHQIRVPLPHPSLSPCQISTKCWSGTGQGFLGASVTYPPDIMESTSTPPLPLPVSKLDQMLDEQEQGKGLEELAAYTHQIFWSTLPASNPNPIPPGIYVSLQIPYTKNCNENRQ